MLPEVAGPARYRMEIVYMNATYFIRAEDLGPADPPEKFVALTTDPMVEGEPYIVRVTVVERSAGDGMSAGGDGGRVPTAGAAEHRAERLLAQDDVQARNLRALRRMGVRWPCQPAHIAQWARVVHRGATRCAPAHPRDAARCSAARCIAARCIPTRRASTGRGAVQQAPLQRCRQAVRCAAPRRGAVAARHLAALAVLSSRRRCGVLRQFVIASDEVVTVEQRRAFHNTWHLGLQAWKKQSWLVPENPARYCVRVRIIE